jgi:hypothetical protein
MKLSVREPASTMVSRDSEGSLSTPAAAAIAIMALLRLLPLRRLEGRPTAGPVRVDAGMMGSTDAEGMLLL